MSSLTDLTIAKALDGLKKKEFSAVELTQAHLDAMAAAKDLNCFITPTPDEALTAAKQADANYQSGKARGLEGVPIGMKDLYCSKGVRTTAGSKMLENFIPTYESTVSQNLLNDGVVVLGKTNMDEFAMGSANITSYYGAVKNPWRATNGAKQGKDLVPGGSSGGSSAAVAARLCLGATASDTGGSIRQPAALTGTVGLKPTYGRCSRWGMVAFASSLDQAGPITRTVEDAALMLNSMAGFDPKDSTSVNVPVPDYTKALTGDIKGMKIGVPKQYRMDGMDSEIEDEWQKGVAWLKDAGAEIIDVSLPHSPYALATYYIVAPAEASSNLARYDGVRYGLREEGHSLINMYENTRGSGFGLEVRRRIMIGTYVLSAGFYDAYYVKAQKVRRLIRDDFTKVFEKVDALLTPTTPNTAFAIGEKMDDPIAMYLNDIFTVPANMAGLPGIALPTGLSKDGLPLGLQIVGPAFGEETILRVADVMEKQANFIATPNKVGEAA